MRCYEVTDEQSDLIEPLIPAAAATGRKRVPPRTVLNGVPWFGLPDHPSMPRVIPALLAPPTVSLLDGLMGTTSRCRAR